jgi:hypothetical protein
MESLVATVRLQEDRKNRIFSLFASIAVILFFCYIVATLFVPGEDSTSSGVNDEDRSSSGSPKFLVPFNTYP